MAKLQAALLLDLPVLHEDEVRDGAHAEARHGARKSIRTGSGACRTSAWSVASVTTCADISRQPRSGTGRHKTGYSRPITCSAKPCIVASSAKRQMK